MFERVGELRVLLAGSGGGLRLSFGDGGGRGFFGEGMGGECGGRFGRGFRVGLAGYGSGGEFLSVEVADDAGYVGFGFEVGRDAAVLVDALRSGIVGGEGFDQIEVIALEEFAEIARAGLDVGLGIEGVAHAELGGGLGHELHEALGAFG